MNRIQFVLALIASVSVEFAQDRDRDDRVRTPEALQRELDLADSQVDQLSENNQAFRTEVRPLARDLSAKLRELRDETSAAMPNTSVIGTLTLEVTDIRRRIDDLRASYSVAAREFLMPDQIALLADLEAVASVVNAYRQAIAYNLIAPPVPDDAEGRVGRRPTPRPGG